jgi:hypothetical protein
MCTHHAHILSSYISLLYRTQTRSTRTHDTDGHVRHRRREPVRQAIPDDDVDPAVRYEGGLVG